jgi:protoheme IX farnesyltransferase
MSQSEALLNNTSRISQFYALTKPRVVQLIVFCALIGMVLAVPGWPTANQWIHMGVACVGIWLVRLPLRPSTAWWSVISMPR